VLVTAVTLQLLQNSMRLQDTLIVLKM